MRLNWKEALGYAATWALYAFIVWLAWGRH
jgi:hypothetical protein